MARWRDGAMAHNMYYRTQGIKENREAGRPPGFRLVQLYWRAGLLPRSRLGLL